MKLFPEIAELLEELKDQISDAKIVRQIETEVRLLVLNVSKLKNKEIMKTWIESIGTKIGEFVEEKSDDIGGAVLVEVEKYKEMVQDTLDGIDETQYCVYQ